MKTWMKPAGLALKLKSKGDKDSSLESQGQHFRQGEDDNQRSSGRKELICLEEVREGPRGRAQESGRSRDEQQRQRSREISRLSMDLGSYWKSNFL